MIYDAPKGGDNTFENAVNKAIDENHNTRVSIMSAQLNDEGKAWEEKLSTSSSTVENYVSERCGNQFENFGTVRLSVVADNDGLYIYYICIHCLYTKIQIIYIHI